MSGTFQIGEWIAEPELNALQSGGKTCRIEPKIMQVLVCLARAEGAVVSKEQILRDVWAETFVGEEVLTRAVSELRRIFGDNPRNPSYIQTIHSRGYRLLQPVIPLPPEGRLGRGVPPAPARRPAPTGSRRRAHWALLVFVGASLGALLLLYALRTLGPSAAEPRTLRLSAFTSERLRMSSLALSPDGRQLVFVTTNDSGVPHLWLQRLDAETPQSLPGTDDAAYPFWAPDSRRIGFFAGGKLYRLSVLAGPPEPVCEAPDGRGGSWNEQGQILFSPFPTQPLHVVGAEGGTPVPVTTLQPDDLSHRFPQFLPGGRTFLFWIWSRRQENRGIYLGSLDSGEVRQILQSEWAGLFTAPGYLLFRFGDQLLGRPFDPQKGELGGRPFPVVERISGTSLGETYFSVARNGTLAFRTAGDEGELVWVDRSGSALATPEPVQANASPWLAPDGRHVVVMHNDYAGNRSGELWMIDLETRRRRRLRQAASGAYSPLVSPDGRQLLFAGGLHPKARLYLSGLDSPLQPVPLPPVGTLSSCDWSPDGAFILYQDRKPATGMDLWAYRLADGSSTPVVQTEADECWGRLSPDGQWVAFVSNESGSFQVYVQKIGDPGSRRSVSASGGLQPAWNPNSRELFYITPDGRMMALPVRLSGAALEVGAASPLFDSRILLLTQRTQYHVSSDGQRFLLHRLPEDTPAASITILLDWAEAPTPLLRRLWPDWVRGG